MKTIWGDSRSYRELHEVVMTVEDDNHSSSKTDLELRLALACHTALHTA